MVTASNPTLRRAKGSSSSSSSMVSLTALLTHGLLGLVCFYVGLLAGVSSSTGSSSSSNPPAACPPPVVCPSNQAAACPPCPPNEGFGEVVSSKGQPNPSRSTTNNNNSNRIFPPTSKGMWTGLATVHREAFDRHLEIGVPLDDTKEGSEDVVVLYQSDGAMPKRFQNRKNLEEDALWGLGAEEALENCGTVKVVLAQPWGKGQSTKCLAVMPQWESYYVHKFMRLPPSGGRAAGAGPVDPKLPLRYVSRTHQDKGNFQQVPDLKSHTKPSYEALVEYLRNLDGLLEDLAPKLASLFPNEASSLRYNPKDPASPKNKSVIVLVCNYGQVELFHNFVCSAKARGLDLSQIFMFATDEKTHELMQELGIPSYYNAAIFGDMPESAARGYGDKIFSKMMMAKVYCVHLVLSLGYSVLFQDVDVVWYKNPLAYLESDELKEWDLMFQDDGARSVRYAPYSPNTGFYYVRFSPETLFFFGMLLRSGDNVAKSSSHQAALTALLNEHVSWKGLRVKTFPKGEQNPFPGGVEYHRQKNLLKKIVKRDFSGIADPYIFHMSWTKNKDNKKLYFQQMGEWYLADHCLTGYGCCLANANVTCHYKDKPSIVPCKDSPPIDKGGRSFW